MQKWFRGYITLPYHIWVMFIGIVVCVIGLIIFFDSHKTFHKTPELPQSAFQKTVTRIPTPTMAVHDSGFHGYDDKKPWFDLALPPECITEKAKEYRYEDPRTITCKTHDFTVIIHPQSGGRDAKITERKNVTLNEITWEEFVLDNDFQYFATYQLNAHKNVYLIGVKYEPFTPEAQRYFETILASFHFID